jgi:DNA-binding transcriptional MerR regulator
METNVTDPQHPIQVVARRTGLSADVIRAWERRYKAVTPQRAANSRRLYSDIDVEKLGLLRRATSAGRRIGDIANQTIDELYKLVENDDSAAALARNIPSERPNTGSVRRFTATFNCLYKGRV